MFKNFRANSKTKTQLQAFFVGGVLPIIAFAVAENWYGVIGGIIAGVAFGVGEILYEYIRFRKIQKITIIGNLLVIGLGALSLFESNPVFFKLQPAILIFLFAALLLGSSLLRRPFLVEMSKKQMPDAPEILRKNLAAMNTRLGFALVILGLVSIHAAYFWSTAAWAFLKGIGAPIFLIAYMALEVLVARQKANQRAKKHFKPSPPHSIRHDLSKETQSK